ncbi:MAG: DNA polymerase III subunit alpha [Defluviitaleaceae bacterium]|nr:DNA polymerase III subunit alpha [Defluviitaleaceae bacterium]
MSFINLNVRSCYSMLGSTIEIPALIEYAQERKLDTVSLVEDGSMHSAVKFFTACKKAKIRPVIGVSLTVQMDETVGKWTFFARNQTGYRVLLKLTSDASLTGVVKVDDIWPHLDHLVVCVNVLDIHGEVDFLVAATEHVYLSIPNEAALEKAKTCVHLKLPFVFLNEVRMLSEADIPILKVLCAIKENVKIDRVNIGENDYFLSAPVARRMGEKDHFLKLAMENTHQIAKLCHVHLDLGRPLLPKFDVASGDTAIDYLAALCLRGGKRRYGKDFSNLHGQRLAYELSVIGSMGFADYFLIVWDFIKHAKQNGILVGPGRGSAAGSMVSYVLGITEVDPIAYELLFERFLNPERLGLPDIDIDFQDDRRDEVIHYVKKKYGAFMVCQIGTFGTFGMRASWRDTARIHGLETAQINAVAKQLTPGSSLAKNLKENGALQRYLEAHPTQRTIYMKAMRIEGLPRHMSTHAAGVIISPADLRNFTAISKGSNDVYLSQYEAVDLEAIGLLKMDFLGLRNLTMIKEISTCVQSEVDPSFEIGKISFENQATYDLISSANTTGIFQLESSGMRAALRQVLPSALEDIISVLALFRPGPMANIPVFAARKHGREHIIYDDPMLQPILEKTYGIIVYQEQIMQIASLVAGYSLGEADILRRAISKKDGHVLEEESSKFVQRAVQAGYEQQVAKKIFDLILRFANYGFNRSHAASYAIISYQMAYLKANYPHYFMTSVLVTQMGSGKGTAAAIKEARSLGIDVLPPSVNESLTRYQVKDGKIRLGFLSVKHIGLELANKLVLARRKGTFITFFDLIMRTRQFLGEKLYRGLIDVGACDAFGYSRATLHHNVNRILSFLTYDGGLFGTTFEMEEAETAERTHLELMEREHELLGFYLQTHPIRLFDDLIEEKGWVRPSEMQQGHQRRQVSCIGFVSRMREIRDKNGNLMAFLELTDEIGQIDVTIFAREYTPEYKNLLNTVLVIQGIVSFRNDRISLGFHRLVSTLMKAVA